MSKKAHYTYQIRASHGLDEKIIFSSIFDLIFKENICTINVQSFFHSFAIQTSSINCQHCIQTLHTNPNLKTNPNSCKNFQDSWKFEFQNPATFSLFQQFSHPPEVSS